MTNLQLGLIVSSVWVVGSLVESGDKHFLRLGAILITAATTLKWITG